MKPSSRCLLVCLAFTAACTLAGCAGGQQDTSGQQDTPGHQDTPGPSKPIASVIPQAAGSWTLKQTGDLSGPQMAYASQDGAKVEIEQLGVGYVVKAPDWKIVMYNKNSKVYFETTQEEFRKQKEKQKGAVDDLGKSMGEKSAPFVKGEVDKIAGLTATQYTSKTGKGDDPSQTEIWFTEEITMPESAVKIVKRPNGEGLPSKGVMLRMIVTTDDGTKSTILDTVSCSRDPIPASTFELPGGYKKVNSESAVVLGGGN